jgi:acyl carrier protein
LKETEIKEKLKNYICNEIIKDEGYLLTENEPLISGGLIDSFSLINLAVFIEKTFDVTIPDTGLNVESMDTVNKITTLILKEKQS